MEFTELWDVCAVPTQSPDLRAVLELWESHRQGAGPVPVWESDVVSLPYAPHLMVVDETEDGDFFYRHYGQGIAGAAGFSMEGKRTSDFQSEAGAFFAQKYREVLAAGAPLYTTHRSSHAKGVVRWERLILPYAMDRPGPPTRLLVYNRPIEFATDLLVAVLDACTDGIIALRYTASSIDGPEQFVVELINAAGEDFLGGKAADFVGKPFPFDTLAPEFFDGVLEAAGRRLGTVVAHERGGRSFRVNVHPSGDLFVVTITDVTQLKRALSEADRLAAVDSLTGVFSRRAIEDAIGKEYHRSVRYSRPLALMMLDIDYFKRANDRHGHAVGDVVLKEVASIVERTLRGQDSIGRVGGDEFVILLPETPLEKAAIVAERLRAALEAAEIRFDGTVIQITASFGVAATRLTDENWRDVLGRADRMLYRSKEKGRNRVTVDILRVVPPRS